MFVIFVDQESHQFHELRAPLLGQRVQHAALCAQHGRLGGLQQLAPRVGHGQQAYAPVRRAAAACDQAARLQPVDHAAYGRGVEANHAREPALVHSGLAHDSRQRAELHGRDAKGLGLLQEHGHGNLLQAPDEKARIGF